MGEGTLVNEFLNTRELSNSKYKEYTEKSKEKTRVYTEEDLDRLNPEKIDTHVSIEEYDTVSYILIHGNNKPLKKRAALNFADGYKRGGEVMSGCTTQEECLCRSSNLYETLSVSRCTEMYYDYNKYTYPYNRGSSSHRLIYSPDVLFFKNCNLREVENITEKNFCDIITCPAPIEGTLEDKEIKHRMENIIKVAADNGVEELILGAWGCGAFGNDLYKFMLLWQEAINETLCVPEIIFSFLDIPDFIKRT